MSDSVKKYFDMIEDKEKNIKDFDFDKKKKDFISLIKKLSNN